MSLAHLTAEPSSDPTPIYRLRDGIYATDLLAAAIVHLDLFTWLAENPSTPGAIAAQFELAARPLDVLVTLCAANGWLTSAGGVLHLTLRAREHLVRGSLWNLGPYYASLKDRPQTLEMLGVLRTGKPANWGGYDADAWARAMERPDFAQQFTAAMDCRGAFLGQALAARLNLSENRALLDIAGGSGIYACALVAKHSHLRAAVFEKSPVDRLAREAIAKQGGEGLVEVVTGDMFAEALPTNFDLHLISNVLHDWEEETVLRILAKSHAALSPGGKLIIHDAHINAEKTGPLPVAQYSALLMHSTEGKCYSVTEMRGYLEQTGFEWIEHRDTAADRSFILAAKG